MKNTYPKKFALIGLPGSGKSTFASKLGKTLNIPVHHLDRHMFEPGGKKRLFNYKQDFGGLRIINWGLLKYTWNFDKEKRARIEELKEKYPQTEFLIFKTQKDADLFLRQSCGHYLKS